MLGFAPERTSLWHATWGLGCEPAANSLIGCNKTGKNIDIKIFGRITCPVVKYDWHRSVIGNCSRDILIYRYSDISSVKFKRVAVVNQRRSIIMFGLQSPFCCLKWRCPDEKKCRPIQMLKRNYNNCQITSPIILHLFKAGIAIPNPSSKWIKNTTTNHIKYNK